MLVAATTGTAPMTAATGIGNPFALYFCQWTLISARGEARAELCSGPIRTPLYVPTLIAPVSGSFEIQQTPVRRGRDSKPFVVMGIGNSCRPPCESRLSPL